MQQLLIIGYVWPEPRSSAAGSRMMQLINFFQKKDYQVTFATTARESANMVRLDLYDIKSEKIKLNDSGFDALLQELNPDVVLFDRYMTEEQFGWRVDTICPDAFKILDTEDLHFLRKAREKSFKSGEKELDLILSSELAKREIAAIYRCDLSLIISEIEMKLLQDIFKLPQELLFYLPFMLSKPTENTSSFEERENFISIGNFLHEPNWNAVLYLKEKIWPEIHKKLPGVKLNIYGAYPSQKVQNLHNERENFIVHGWTEDAMIVMEDSRVCLAPIQFGAGLKGKLAEAMQCGTPSITTTIGSEGMAGDLPWNGYICDMSENFISQAIKLYSNNKLWEEKQKYGFKIINERFNDIEHQNRFDNAISKITAELEIHRKQNFTGSMLKHHLHKSTYFMSKYIEEKNRLK